jgi:hypothetical protein
MTDSQESRFYHATLSYLVLSTGYKVHGSGNPRLRFGLVF